MAVEETPDRAGRERGAMLAAEQTAQLDRRDVHLGLDRGQAVARPVRAPGTDPTDSA